MDAEPDSFWRPALAEKAVLLKRGGAPGSVREGITTLLEAFERETDDPARAAPRDPPQDVD